jgi:release factor glutamine methyltransferase
MNGRELVREATATLAAAGVESPRVDAELLLAHVLGAPRAAWPSEVAGSDVTKFRDLVARRATREPLQYLTGTAPFRYAMLAVGPGVFIPRPETELLVDAVLPTLKTSSRPVVLDLCSGSGALAVALAQEVPAATVIAVERSADALAWLRRNTAGTAIEVVAADITAPGLLDDRNGQVDAIVSNPPYVPTDTPVQAEVSRDPAEAVFAGPDGLSVIPAVISLAGRLLRAGGVVAIEHDESHALAVTALLERSGQWSEIADHLDLTGRSRYATAVHL